MVRCSGWALLGSLALADDEFSTLQMPIMEKTLQTEEDASDCRCPGYFREQCEAEAPNGCVWTDAGSSNVAWCQCRSNLEPGWVPPPRVIPEPSPVIPEPEPDPVICCRALTADCLACSAGVAVGEYCDHNPDTQGCVVVPEPVICCSALTAGCLACSAGVTVGEYCERNPDTQGCEPVIIEPPSGEECCAPHDQRPAFCSGLDYPLAIGDGFTSDYTEVGTIFNWNDGTCFEMHTGCCWFHNDLGCLACQNNVLPEDFCNEHSEEHPELCLTGEDCCVESPPEGCSGVLFPMAVGHGFTSDYREVHNSIEWSGGACHSNDIFCCHWDSLECAACTINVLPEDFCDEHGADYPQFCVIIEPVSPEECCAESPPEYCAGVDYPRAIGDGRTTDYTETGVVYLWQYDACFEMHTSCCGDINDLACVACMNNVHSDDFCNEHREEYPQLCLTGEDCCVDPVGECSGLHFNRASSYSTTVDFRELHHTVEWDGFVCHESEKVCCQAEDVMSCVACMNNILPEAFCAERGVYNPELCIGHIAVAGPPVHVLVDSSDSNEKCVTAPVAVICSDDAGHLGNRINTHSAADTFDITVGGDNRDQVCARRTDSSGGWGMHLEIVCVSAPVHILIDNSDENRKCVTHTFPVACAGDSGHLGNRINTHQAGDTFDITTSGNEVCAQRTDSNGGWGMHLEIACVAASHEELVGQIVSAPPLNVLIDNSDQNEKCIDAPYPVVCASDSGHLGNRVNTHQADDQFEITTDGSRVCARRLDHDGGWGMHLEVTCVAAPIYVFIGNSNDNRQCVPAPTAVQCADDAGHLGNRVNTHTAGDTFEITSGGLEVCARRTDSGGGWGMQLEIVCVAISPITGEDCCVASPPEGCANVQYLRALGHGMTEHYTEVGTVYNWEGDVCHEMVTQCCDHIVTVFNAHNPCLACSHGVLPQDFCVGEHRAENPELCLTGEDCCTESPPDGCSAVIYPLALGMGFTSDHRETGREYQWTNGACHNIDTMCCQDESLSCVACRNGVLPEELCNDHSSEYPQFCGGVIAVAGPPVHVLIDNSDSNEKCVTAPVAVICADDAGHLGNRINSHSAADTFEITVGGDNRDQVCARRSDSSGGWGMHLEIPCVSAPVHILIDNSDENRKCVTHSFPVTCAGDAGHLGNRINSHQAGDTFDVTTSGNEVCAQRTDSTGGWGMHLEIACIAASQEELVGQIVSAPPLIVLVDNSDQNEKCVDTPYPVVCASDSGHLGNRINTHQADDQFEITTDGSQVCARRLDHDGGWGMHLEVTCVAAPIFVFIGNSNDNRMCVTAPIPVTCADDAGHLGTRVNSHPAGDTFEITSVGEEVCARRTDSGGGWGMQLEIVCVASEPALGAGIYGTFNGWSAAAGVHMLAGDFNGDGKRDVALLGGPGWGSIPVAHSFGNGQWSVTNCAVPNMNSWIDAQGARPLVGDFNGDGRDDIALTGGNGWGSIPVAFAEEDGCFRVTNSAVSQFPSWAATSNVQSVVGDFDGDGKADIAAIGRAGWGSLPTAFGNGDGTFRVTNLPLGGSFNDWSSTSGVYVLAGDFNADGKDDVALIGGPGWGSIPVAVSAGDGSYNSITNCAVPHMNGWIDAPGARPLVGDFNGDGRSDIALTGGHGWGSIPVAFSEGAQCFRVTNTGVAHFPSWAATHNVQAVATDVDGDGHADIAAIGNSGWGTLPVAFGNGDGSFRVVNERI